MERITDHIAIHLGDSLEMLRKLSDASIHCCVTDPPYGLKFMGKKWDYDVPAVEIWAEVLRVLKPGGTLLSFAGSRTQHRMAVNIEDAGLRLCDTLLWLYGQGWPKGRNISKEIDRTLGVEQEIIGKHPCPAGNTKEGNALKAGKYSMPDSVNITVPATDAAKQWDGWTSHALKPAYEPIIMAMKPNDGSYANNALTHGVAGLHIDTCRVGTEGGGTHCTNRDENGKCRGHKNAGRSTSGETFHAAESSGGRYPANILHDGSDEATADMGKAARFFYCAKASKADRGEGNTHPTVKPQALMQWLVRLVCPPDGVVLDPFMGSGTTGVACAKEGFDFLGSERDTDSYATAKRRLT